MQKKNRFYAAMTIRLQASLLLLTLTTGYSSYSHSEELPELYIYLAGPEVFLPEPVEAGELAKQKIQQLNESNDWPFTLVGLYPLDNEIENFAPDFDTGIRIYDANIALMNKADFIAANMVRFRGPSMDVGTAFEMGYMAGLSKPVFSYYEAEPFYGAPEEPGLYKERVIKYYEKSDNPLSNHAEVDVHGQSVENFAMSDNLMMIGALQTGGKTVATTLEEAVLQIADYVLSSDVK